MVKTFAINENNDLYLTPDGNIAIVDGIEAVAQACQTAAQAYLGEMIYSVDKGVPYFETLFNVGQPQLQQFEAGLRTTLLSVLGVTGILSLDTELVADNVVTYTAQITTIYGETVVNGNSTV